MSEPLKPLYAQPLLYTLDELIEWALTALPYSTVGEDNDGQLVIYTNLYENDHGRLANYNDPED